MYKNVEYAKYLTCHTYDRVIDGMLRHLANSLKWTKFDNDYPEFKVILIV